MIAQFTYPVINSENKECLEINRLMAATICYFDSCKLIYRSIRAQLYNTVVLPVLIYGSEVSTMTEADEGSLAIFERKDLYVR